MDKVEIRTGTEGPSHDPYGFTEFSFMHELSGRVVLHLGLAEYLRIGDAEYDGYGNLHGGCTIEEKFESLAGLHSLSDLYEEEMAEPVCEEHPDAGTEEVDGYPGEHFLVCAECHKILDTRFCESEVI